MGTPGLTENCDLARGGREQTLEDFDGGGLPCAVRTEQPEAFAGSDGQRQASHRFDLAVVGFAQLSAFDGGRHRGILAERS